MKRFFLAAILLAFLYVSPALGLDYFPVVSGTYTPTLTNVTNVDASTAFVSQYRRLGDIVCVTGKVNIDATANTTSTDLGFSIPVASNFANEQELAGTMTSPSAQESGAVLADTTNDRAVVRYVSTGTGNTQHFVNFCYQVI
jgi:hypothetical protein